MIEGKAMNVTPSDTTGHTAAKPPVVAPAQPTPAFLEIFGSLLTGSLSSSIFQSFFDSLSMSINQPLLKPTAAHSKEDPASAAKPEENRQIPVEDKKKADEPVTTNQTKDQSVKSGENTAVVEAQPTPRSNSTDTPQTKDEQTQDRPSNSNSQNQLLNKEAAPTSDSQQPVPLAKPTSQQNPVVANSTPGQQTTVNGSLEKSTTATSATGSNSNAQVAESQGKAVHSDAVSAKQTAVPPAVQTPQSVEPASATDLSKATPTSATDSANLVSKSFIANVVAEKHGLQLPEAESPAPTQASPVAAKAAAPTADLPGFGNRAPEKASTPQDKLSRTLGTLGSNQQQIIEKIDKAIETALKGRNPNSLVVHLDPPELGNLTVKVTKRGDQLYARISPESPDVEAILRAKLPELSRMLTGNGVKIENIHVSIGQERPEADFNRFFQERGGQTGGQPSGQTGENAKYINGVGAPRVALERTAPNQAGWIA